MSARMESELADGQVRIEVRFGSDDPLGKLRGLCAASERLDAWHRHVVADARDQGVSWARIAEVMRVSKQAAWASYNEDVRGRLAQARERSQISDAEARSLADDQRDGNLPL